MKSIHQVIENTLIINKSKFITILIPITSINEINNHLNQIKTTYKEATHYCYAYLLENIKRFSDDGEPSGTAGMPILNVLEKNQLTNILCIVVRYFGGIKLGAGGLVRAYTKSVTNCLDYAELKELKECYQIKLLFSYESIKQIDNFLKNVTFLDKSFEENIEYVILIECDFYEEIKMNLDSICKKVDIIEKRIV